MQVQGCLSCTSSAHRGVQYNTAGRKAIMGAGEREKMRMNNRGR